MVQKQRTPRVNRDDDLLMNVRVADLTSFGQITGALSETAMEQQAKQGRACRSHQHVKVVPFLQRLGGRPTWKKSPTLLEFNARRAPARLMWP